MNPSWWSRLVGPTATPTDNAAIAAGMAVGGILGWVRTPGRPGRRAVAALLVSDLLGGAVANNTTAGRQWHHRPGTNARNHVAFAALHVHPFILAKLHDTAATDALALYGYALAGTALTAAAPRAWQLPTGALLASAGSAVFAAARPGSPLAPIAPPYLIKLLAGHAAAP